MIKNIYAYTINYQTGKINEYHGYLCESKYDRKYGTFQHYESRKYLTRCPMKEGVVFQACIWFSTPNIEKAKEAFACCFCAFWALIVSSVKR